MSGVVVKGPTGSPSTRFRFVFASIPVLLFGSFCLQTTDFLFGRGEGSKAESSHPPSWLYNHIEGATPQSRKHACFCKENIQISTHSWVFLSHWQLVLLKRNGVKLLTHRRVF